jgi:hypothetical protein
MERPGEGAQEKSPKPRSQSRRKDDERGTSLTIASGSVSANPYSSKIAPRLEGPAPALLTGD